MTWIGYIVRWELLDTADGSRMQAFESFGEALDKTRWLTCEASQVGKASMQRVEHQMLCGWSDTENLCRICQAIEDLHHVPEGPVCGVCDALGHTTENCRSGDAPYDPRDEEF